MTDIKNLLPCPMCGCSNITVKNEQPADNSGGYFIECPECGISTSLRYACGDDPIPMLAELWNHRVSAQCLHQIAEPVANLTSELADMLERSITGLGHYRNTDRWSEADEEHINECNALLERVNSSDDEREAAPQAVQPAVPQGWKPGQLITEEMHAAACKVLFRAHGLEGTPQRMLDAMLSAARGIGATHGQ